MSAPDRARSTAMALALVAVFVCFAPTLRFEFVDWDDPIHLLQNPLVLHPSDASLRDHLLTPSLGYPLPIPVLVYRAMHAAVGVSSALPYHALSVALHLLACFLVSRLARAFGLSPSSTALAVILFGVHPVVAESVSWISGQKDLLVTTFALGALVLALREATLSFASRAGVLALSVLALACKPVAAFLVLAVPATRVAIFRVSTWRELLHAIPFTLVVLAYVPLAFAGQSHVHAIAAPTSLATQLRVVHYALGFHLDLALLLVEPASKYMPRIYPPPFTPVVDLMPAAVFALLGAIFASLSPSRRRPFVAACVLAVLAYAPNSNVIPLTRFLADTYVYLPLVGLALALALGFDEFASRVGSRRHLYERLVPTFAAIALTLLAIPASARYENSLVLWTHTLRANPHEMRICRNWAIEVRKVEGPERGLAAVDRCIARFGRRELEKTRGYALLRLGRTPEALGELEEALRSHPDDARLRELVDAIRASRVPVDAVEPTAP